jgi:phosphomannomutase / phosphoglucomutase
MLQLNPRIFREYDVRGTVEVDLSEDFAYLLGRAYATLVREHKKDNIAIGYDCRLTSKNYAASLARGLSDEGISSFNTGMGPTPQLYYAIYSPQSGIKNCGGGIQVTGSHNPPEMNGFKICLGTHALAGDEIQDLYNRCVKINGQKPSASTKGAIKSHEIQSTYIAELVKNVQPHFGKRKLKIVVDAGNGVGGLVGPQTLRALGCEVTELYCEPDGRFPNHHPDPTVMENIIDLIQKVKETKADFGIGWDGDADRIGVVDERGQVVFGDMLLLIYGRELLKTVPHATVVGDVKCSSLLFDDLNKRGANAVMWKTGHSLIKAKLKELNGDLAGEMSGHICFKNRFYGFDDALYCTLRFAEIMSNTSAAVSALLADLPKMVSTPEIRVDCPEEIKFKIPEAAKKEFAQYKLTTIDGVRMTFEHGWALIRASNTQPVLVMRFEAENQSYLDQYQKIVNEGLERIKSTLR